MKSLPKGLKISKHAAGLNAMLYQTRIVVVSGSRITLRTGGWFTPHTKKCMNLVLAPYKMNVSQIKNVWYVCAGDTKVAFQDEMTIDVSAINNLIQEAA